MCKGREVAHFSIGAIVVANDDNAHNKHIDGS